LYLYAFHLLSIRADQQNETSELLPVNPDGSRSVDRGWDQRKTWEQLEEVYDEGAVKAIGVSNWSIPYLEHLKESWKVVPAVNQVELHPYNPQHKLKAWCDKEGILLESYCPLGSTSEPLTLAHVRYMRADYSDSPLLTDKELGEIASKHGVSVATILISYQVNRGIVVLPKSVTKQRITDNLKVISLDDGDMKILNGMAAGGKQQRVNTPKWGWDLGFDDWYGPIQAE
jgi:glycerol 2-dehydrogenase (NADP+)